MFVLNPREYESHYIIPISSRHLPVASLAPRRPRFYQGWWVNGDPLLPVVAPAKGVQAKNFAGAIDDRDTRRLDN